jgi:hypothetical protein
MEVINQKQVNLPLELLEDIKELLQWIFAFWVLIKQNNLGTLYNYE